MTALVATRVAVAPGDGLLARRADGLLFVGRSVVAPAGEWSDALDAFIHAGATTDAVQAVLDHAVDHHLEVGPFAVVTWGATVHLVVFGDLSVVTDLPSVPRLSGAGMPTWVEHRATRVPERATVRLGDEPVAGSDLIAGIVPAAGFQVALAASNTAPPPPVRVAPVPTESVGSGATRTPEPAATPQRPAAPHGAGSWDLLREAGGGWMDDSLQLSEARRTPAAPPPAPAAAPPQPAPEQADAFDPEVTLDAKAFAPAAGPLDEAPPEPAPLVRYVQARRCDVGHLNPPLRTRCRTCDHYLPAATPTETVPQPVLAVLVLDDGRTIDVAGPVVLGRIPSAEAGRLDEPGALVRLGDATVSRTHAVVTVDGWTLLAIDCGATGGTAIAPSGGEPTLLEPWVPHELAIGDTLFLGGPTKINVVAVS
jgi:hypothetical protein